ncbi:MAG: hypothetical protein KDD84_22900, partial [Caldilineaceae bacterium]|nr:hypothetical protein [Caldilineaceae bacterium]
TKNHEGRREMIHRLQDCMDFQKGEAALSTKHEETAGNQDFSSALCVSLRLCGELLSSEPSKSVQSVDLLLPSWFFVWLRGSISGFSES